MESESESESIRALIKQYQILRNVRWQHNSQYNTITALERDQYEVLWSRVQQYWTRRMPSSILLYSAPLNLILIKFKCSNCFITYGSILLLILKFYQNWNFWKFSKFYHFEFFWNSMKYLKVLKFYENFQIC